MQAAFIAHDGFQCGYCTPGQICSAVALLGELQGRRAQRRDLRGDAAGRPPARAVTVSDAEIRERMSGNICRCGAYANIVAAVRVAGRRRQRMNDVGYERATERRRRDPPRRAGRARRSSPAAPTCST